VYAAVTQVVGIAGNKSAVLGVPSYVDITANKVYTVLDEATPVGSISHALNVLQIGSVNNIENSSSFKVSTIDAIGVTVSVNNTQTFSYLDIYASPTNTVPICWIAATSVPANVCGSSGGYYFSVINPGERQIVYYPYLAPILGSATSLSLWSATLVGAEKQEVTIYADQR
jgi:hypothetical protein